MMNTQNSLLPSYFTLNVFLRLLASIWLYLNGGNTMKWCTSAHLFPVLCSVMILWWLKIRQKSWEWANTKSQDLFCSEEQLLHIHQNTTGYVTFCCLRYLLLFISLDILAFWSFRPSNIMCKALAVLREIVILKES